MDVAGCSLAEVRKRLAAGLSELEERELLRALRADPRRGATALAETLERRREALRVESERISGLMRRRADLRAAGVRFVAGVDEVGMGPLAGPVVAGAVVLPDTVDLRGLDDSKKLSRTARERLDQAIREQAIAVCVAEVSPGEVDRLNVYHAGLTAMRRAVEGLEVSPEHVLVDARTIPGIRVPQTGIKGGDALDASIAAASVVAKVYRDALMHRLDTVHPGYGFASHKGYPTSEHLRALERLGPSPVHRRSFGPVAQCSQQPASQ